MPAPIIPEPQGDLSNRPDRATQRALDYTGPQADNRVLFLDCGFFRFGTRDLTQATALLITVALIVALIIIAVIGQFGTNQGLVEKVMPWLQNTIVFTAGVALGRGTARV